MKASKLLSKKQIFYEEYADGVFRFNDKNELKFNKAILSTKSQYFRQLFSNSTHDEPICIQDYDMATYKLFLDCLLKFQEMSTIDALLIFPIAWKYDTENLIKKCINLLKPTELNDNTCITLNIASFCECQELMDVIINFLKNKNLIHKLLDNEDFCYLLDPEALLILLNHVRFDSFTLWRIFSWGQNYIKAKNKSIDLKTFFKENKINKKLNFGCFETTGSFFDFNKSEFGKNYFTGDDFRDYMEWPGLKVGKSEWFSLKAGDMFTEKFIVRKVTFLQNFEVMLCIYRSPIVLYCNPGGHFFTAGAKGKNFVYHPVIHYYCSCHMIDSNDEIIVNERKQELGNHAFDSTHEQCFKIVHKSNTVSDVEIRVQLTFRYDCRILKFSPENFMPVESCTGNLYFIRDVEFKYEKRK